MSSATTTVRELKNKDTGIDISVPSHKEIKGLLHSSFEYQVVVVSILPYFKSPKHKDSDVVQFMVSRRFQDFEDLHNKLSDKYPATVLPPLPKKVLIVNDNAAKARRAVLESFMKFLAGMPKLSTSAILLEFLGVNAIKAGKYRKEDSPEASGLHKDEKVLTVEQQPEDTSVGIFDDPELDDNEDGDIFDEETEDKEGDFFTTSSGNDNTKLFDDPDLGGALDDDEANTFLQIVGTKNEVKVVSPRREDEEDNLDILQIDDDLEKFSINHEESQKDVDNSNKNKLQTNKQQEAIENKVSMETLMEPVVTDESSVDISEKVHQNQTEKTCPTKPTITRDKPKPTPRTKPSIPSNAKPVSKSQELVNEATPASSSKPNIKPKPKQIDSNDSRDKPPVKPRPKPSTPAKPEIKRKPITQPFNDQSERSNVSTEKTEISDVKDTENTQVDSLNTNDILQYIQQANTEDDDVDLFS